MSGSAPPGTSRLYLDSFDYLERLPGTTFQKLYKQPATALAIFRRLLPHLAKSFVMALLYMSKPLPLTDLNLWVQSDSKKQKDEALSAMTRLHIATVTVPARDVVQLISLTKSFRQSLRHALTGGGTHNSFGVPIGDEDPNVTLQLLDQYATSQWEGILHYLVMSAGGGRGDDQGPTPIVKQLLMEGELVSRQKFSNSTITRDGFSFLLQEVNTQVWALLLIFIQHAETLDLEASEILSFLFMLGSLELGQGYSTVNLTESQKKMLEYLFDLGLVFIPTADSPNFFPTRLATTLTSDASALRNASAGFESALTAPSGEKGFIIIETNFRLYAYTSSPLQIAVLDLFARLKTRYPNMITAQVTRKSIRKAIARGITSDQIIKYLTTHAHPRLHQLPAVVAGGPVLPPTVVDQIRLWQIETERMETTVGFLFKDFENQKEYDACVKYADENGVLVWRNDAKRLFFVRKMEQLRDYIKARKGK